MIVALCDRSKVQARCKNWITMAHLILSTLINIALIICTIFGVIWAGDFTHHGIKLGDVDTNKLLSSLDPTVELKQGTVIGNAELSRNGRVFLSFKGIPYGKVPQRFNDAIPEDAWKGTLNAKEFGPSCAQNDLFTKTLKGSEDCLSVNVFVPKTETKETLPVMVWIYGGAFVVGESKMYFPSYFMDEDVIFVSINYRLGPFGFLNAGVKGASGNQALKDMVLGLKWVQENIASFGGDTKRVTIFGESAGGAAVSHLVISPMAKGLFSGAIAQSGSANAPFAIFPDPDFDQAKMLAQGVDCPTSNREFMVECLRKIKPEVIAKAAEAKDFVWFERANGPVFAPGIEYYKESEESVFLGENLENILEEGRFNKVPVMMGFTAQEGLATNAAPILMIPNNTRRINEEWGRVVPQALMYWKSAKDPCVVSTKLKNMYLPGKTVGLHSAQGLVEMYSDMVFEYPARRVGIQYAKYAPVYFYKFIYPVQKSYVDLFQYPFPNPEAKVPAHADELQFLFSGLQFWPNVPKDSQNYEFSINFVKLWTSFVKTGKPSYLWGNVQNVYPVNASDSKHLWLQIDKELTLLPESDEFLAKMANIEDIYVNDLGVKPDK